MKQKYTITIADMELNIISDASPDEVESIVGILDRRMREINLKSPRCTKNEAAILCALSYCSERIAMQEAFKKVEKDAFRFAGENEKLKRNIEELQEEIDRLRRDAVAMKSILDHAAANAEASSAASAENSSRAAAPRRPFGKTEVGKATVAPIPMGDQLSAFDAIPTESVETDAVEEIIDQPNAVEQTDEVQGTEIAEETSVASDEIEEAAVADARVEETVEEKIPEKAENSKTKSRIGTMFDLLTFSDV